MNKNNNTYVTQPYLPPLEEFLPYLREIWDSKWLTNGGPFHQRLEVELARVLGVEHLALFTNGTLALVTALQALRITGEVITTPFSFVATAHSLLWNGIRPIFADIDPHTLTLNAEHVESLITPQTTAILPVHVYGIPCNVERLQKIADTYGLKMIYDAAHAFGIQHKGQSLLRHGDMSILSFHATKVFTTFEGGALVCPDAKTKQRVDYLKNFGFADELTVVAPGINAKMSEVQAAMGLLQIKHIDEVLARRRHVDRTYRAALQNVAGIRCLSLPLDATSNYGYFPVLVEADYPLTRDQLYELLRAHSAYARRYFYPLISEFPMYRELPSAAPDRLPVAHAVSRKILCLPIFPDIDLGIVEKIVALIRSAARSG